MKEQRPARRMRGFEPASGLLKERIREAGESRGFAVTRLLTHWPEVVGEEVAGAALPVKIGYGRGAMGATLTLLTTGAMAPIVEMQKERIKERVNACYGYAAVSRVLVTQTAPEGFAEGRVAFTPKPVAPPVPDPVATKAAEAVARDVANPGLRAALEALGTNVLTRTAGRKA
jgi:hypothetical protein